MLQRLMEKDGTADTSLVSETSSPAGHRATSFGTVKKAVTGWVGARMSSVEEWLTEEKSYETTGVGILLSLIGLATIFGVLLGYRISRQRTDEFWMGGNHYVMLGVANIPVDGRTVYTPLYEVKKQ